jgi:hypothetical protein
MTRQRFPNTPRHASAPIARRYVTAVLAREVLRKASAVLSARGIAVMPLKGVLFQLVLYADPAQRALTDVDILVPEHAFAAAIEALLQAGFSPLRAGRSLNECALRAPSGMTLDLHQQLFSRGRYKLSGEALFRRATLDHRLLGVPLHVAHPHDTAAHLIGKFVADHEGLEPLQRLQELARWVNHCSIDPWRLARHLCRCGMARAARYTLGRAAELLDDPFFPMALAALPADPLGRVCERAARTLIAGLGQSTWAAVPAHVLNTSLVRGGMSLALSARQRLRHAWLARRGGAGAGCWSPFFVASVG